MKQIKLFKHQTTALLLSAILFCLIFIIPANASTSGLSFDFSEDSQLNDWTIPFGLTAEVADGIITFSTSAINAQIAVYKLPDEMIADVSAYHVFEFDLKINAFGAGSEELIVGLVTSGERYMQYYYETKLYVMGANITVPDTETGTDWHHYKYVYEDGFVTSYRDGVEFGAVYFKPKEVTEAQSAGSLYPQIRLALKSDNGQNVSFSMDNIVLTSSEESVAVETTTAQATAAPATDATTTPATTAAESTAPATADIVAVIPVLSILAISFTAVLIITGRKARNRT